MTPTLFQGLMGLHLTDGRAVTASKVGLAGLYADIATHYHCAHSMEGLEVVQEDQAVVPKAVQALEADFDELASRLRALCERAGSDWGSITAANAGLVVTCPTPLSTGHLELLGLEEPSLLIEADNLASGLHLWQQALNSHPDIDRWLWLSLDSRCTLDWVDGREIVFSPNTHPEGELPGEALVLTEWRRRAEGPRLGFAGSRPEINGAHALSGPVSARAELMRAAEPGIDQRPPDWAECFTNDDFGRANASERYKTEVDIWPRHEPDTAQGPGNPFVSWYATLGDVGLAALPLGLLLARERMSHLMRPRHAVGVLINDGEERHYWRLESPAPQKN